MRLNVRQSYLAMFDFLNKIYYEIKDDCMDDDFVSLLSGFNPYLFTDGMPADPAAWGDWKNAVNIITKEKLLTSAETLCATIGFIKFHNDEFGFKLQWLINRLDLVSAENPEWQECIFKAMTAPLT